MVVSYLEWWVGKVNITDTRPSFRMMLGSVWLTEGVFVSAKQDIASVSPVASSGSDARLYKLCYTRLLKTDESSSSDEYCSVRLYDKSMELGFLKDGINAHRVSSVQRQLV